MNHQAIRPRICGPCPFKAQTSTPLDRERRQGIADSLRAGESFICHKENPELGARPPGDAGPRLCNGAASLLDRNDEANDVMTAAWIFGEPPFCQPHPEAVPYRSLDSWVNS